MASRPRKKGVDAGVGGQLVVDSRAAAHLAWHDEGVGVGARAVGDGGGAVAPRAQHTNVGCVKQLLGPQHPVARHEDRVDASCVSCGRHARELTGFPRIFLTAFLARYFKGLGFRADNLGVDLGFRV